MPEREATEEVRYDTTHYQSEGILFYQLLLPLCDTPLSRIWEDKRIPYNSDVEKWSHLYACHIGLGGSYGHVFKPMKIPEIVCHDGCIVRNGVRGGTNGTFYCRWQMGADYDDDIAQGINYRRWIQIKRVKNSATTTQQQGKNRAVTIQATKLITYGDDLFTTSIFSEITPNFISVGMKQVGKQQVMVRRGLG